MGEDTDNIKIQIQALIDRNNTLEDKVQRLEWDLKFIHTWINKNRPRILGDGDE